MKIFIKILIYFLITVYLSILIVLYLYQEKLIFVPSKLAQNHKFKLKNVNEIKIKVEGADLSALHFKNENPRGIIFFLHGNAGNLDTWLTGTEFYEKVNYDLVMLDYRGYGKSTGQITSEKQLFDDIYKVWNEIAPLYKDKKIIIYGRSLGTAPAAYLSELIKPNLTILVTPYFNLNSLRKLFYPWVPSFIMRYKLDTAKYLANLKNKILIIHGTNDELIPFNQALELKNINENSEIMLVEGATHNDIHTFKKYLDFLEYKINTI